MAWKELFGTEMGLLSVFTIAFVMVIAVFFIGMFNKKMNEKPGQE